ncbi:hypothetical protein D3C77_708840 [compost metagenome]
MWTAFQVTFTRLSPAAAATPLGAPGTVGSPGFSPPVGSSPYTRTPASNTGIYEVLTGAAPPEAKPWKEKSLALFQKFVLSGAAILN